MFFLLRKRVMIQALYDIRFAFDSDNPFEQDHTKTCLNKLKKHLAEHADDFTEIDYLETSKYLLVCPDVKTLFGEEVDRKSCVSNKLNEEIKKFIKDNIPKLPEELSKWIAETPGSVASKAAAVGLGGGSALATPLSTTSAAADMDAAMEELGNGMLIPPVNEKFGQSLSIGLHYDIGSDKALGYEEVCKLCMNIARTKLVESNAILDPTVAALERERRKKLTYEINRYRNSTLISAMVEADLTEMSLEQLETCLEQCKRLQENYKVLETCKRLLNASGTVYNTVCPEGIPISKTKRVCFKGMGKEVLNTLFNPTTTTGIAFQNILSKNNIHVSDEALTLLAFADICISKVEIKTVEPKAEEDDGKVTMEQLEKVNDAIRKDVSKQGQPTNLANQELEDVDEYEEEYEDE